jgi:hypothetical protein
MNEWRQGDIRKNISAIFAFIFLVAGQIPFVNLIMNHFTGTGLGESLAGLSRIYGNILLMPAMILFLISVTSVMRKAIPRGRRLLYILAGIGVPLCIMLLTLAGGTLPPMRSLFALPLAFAFMLFFLIKMYKKKASTVIICLALLVAAYQAQISAQLFYSDQMRYNDDVRIAYELNNLITPVQPDGRKLPVVLIGPTQTASRFHSNFLQGEYIGLSLFGVKDSPYLTTVHGLAFMRTLGINYSLPNDNQLAQALKEAVSMPAYPDPGCVKRMRDFIVVRMSETLY